MSSDNLPHQMQPQNVGRVGVGAGIEEVSQHCFRVANAVIPNSQYKLSIFKFCHHLNLTSAGIVPDAVIQEVVYGSCQQFFVCFQRCLSRRFPDQKVNAEGFF